MYADRFFWLFLLLAAPFNSWCQNADSIALADQQYNQGKALYYDGEYRSANTFFEKALHTYRTQLGDSTKEVVKTYGRLGDVARRLRLHPQALEYYGRGIELARQLDDADSEYLADFQIDIGHVYSQMYRPQKANRIYHESLKVYQKKYGEASSKVGNTYMSIGLSWIKMGQYRNARYYLQKAFDIFKKTSEPNSVDFNRIYNNMGYLFRKTGAFEEAVDYGEKALEIKLLNYKASHPSVPKYYRNIGRALQEWGKYEEALPYFRKTAELSKIAYGGSHSTTAGSYGELGNILADLGRNGEALEQYNKSITILEKTLAPTHPYLVGGYFNIGRIYQDQEDYERALVYYEEVLKKFYQSEVPPTRQIAETQGQVASVLLLQGRADQALVRCNKAIESLVAANGYQAQNEYDNPPLTAVQTELEFLNLLQTKSQCLEARYAQKAATADLEAALATSSLAIELVRSIQQSFASESSRQWISEKADEIFTLAIDQAYQLYEQSGDFSFAQKAYEFAAFSKASLLWQHLTEAQARQIARLPDEAAQKLQQLETDMQLARERWTESPNDDSRRQFRESRLAYLAADEQLEATHADYRRLKSASNQASLEDLQQYLRQQGSALVEYFYSEEHLYIFLLTQKSLQARKVSIDKQFEIDIQEVRHDRLASMLGDQGAIGQFQAALFRLHERLIAPIQASIPSQVDRLIVIPHQKLQLLSFEMLAPRSAEKSFKKLGYLLRNYGIQYSWSAGLLLQQQKNQTTPSYEVAFLGMAPNFSELAEAKQVNYRQSLASLKFNQQEIEDASQRLGGKVLLGGAASESAFQQWADQSRLLHLATHGIADDRNPLQSGLFFSPKSDSLEDGFLSALEIYGMKIPTEMAVLSACNTGYGQLASGEGVMSLGRAFTYAGSQSVLMSLWLANDQSTARIMNQLYQNLQKGRGKQEALRQAKLDYLASADPVEAHPYFWAGIIATGDMRPITGSSFAWMSWQLWGIAALLIWWFFSRLKWRNQ